MQCLSWFAVSRAVVLLFCGTLMVSCSQAPPEAAPEFTLPLSQVTTVLPSPEQRPRLHQRQAGSGTSRCHLIITLPAWPARALL